MTDQTDAQEDELEWQFSEPTEGDAFGGGLLRQVLDEVSALRADAAADRSTLATTIAQLVRQLEELQNTVQGAAERSEESAEARATAQNDAIAAAIAAALRSELSAVSDAIVTTTSRLAVDLQRLRIALLGPD